MGDIYRCEWLVSINPQHPHCEDVRRPSPGSQGIHIPSNEESGTSLSFPLDLLLNDSEVGGETDSEEDASLPCDDFLSAKLGGTVNCNLKHVN